MEKENKFSEYAAALLRASGLKVTPIRTGILKFLIEAGNPLSHSEIQDMNPDLDRVTIYRALAGFVKNNVIHQVQGTDGILRFCAHKPDKDGCPGNHPHFLCNICGKMICLTDHKLARADIPESYEVKGKQFVIYGQCPACAEKRKK